MKYQKIIDAIKFGKMSRADLFELRNNAIFKQKQGDQDAHYVVEAVNHASPHDDCVLFMGFCPSADTSNRLDVDWKEKGICYYDYLENEVQTNRFGTICAGDLVILKKNAILGKTMTLHGFGRVIQIAYDDTNIRYLKMIWSAQESVIKVPAMAATVTVNIRLMSQVEQVMPPAFADWLSA